MNVVPASLRNGRPPVGPESIRELVFGVEDGVVQNLTLIAGMVGGGLSSAVIVFAGAVNAIAGVLSMSMGTYLSSKAEQDVAAAVANGHAPFEQATPGRDAAVMAGAYAVGAFVPILPFALSFLDRPVSLGLAVVLALLTLFILGYGKAVVSHQRRVRSGMEMLVLASAAGLLGFLLGALARGVFGLDV
ncbi:MAG: VIT1/CCC1 transporter family protein [Acidimicrobiia bacterium]|nr:VIT1/CCC1 transporter family protein [Acidimicrobiia bacterium]